MSLGSSWKSLVPERENGEMDQRVIKPVFVKSFYSFFCVKKYSPSELRSQPAWRNLCTTSWARRHISIHPVGTKIALAEAHTKRDPRRKRHACSTRRRRSLGQQTHECVRFTGPPTSNLTRKHNQTGSGVATYQLRVSALLSAPTSARTAPSVRAAPGRADPNGGDHQSDLDGPHLAKPDLAEFGQFCLTEFGQTAFGHFFWWGGGRIGRVGWWPGRVVGALGRNRLWPSLSDRLWPNRLWPHRLGPKSRF